MLKNWLLRWNAKRQRKELIHFLDMVRGASHDELAYQLVVAQGLRLMTLDHYPEGTEQLSDFGIVAKAFRSYPAIDRDELAFVPLRIAGIIKELQSIKNYQAASGWMIWIHTWRAAINLENRFLVKETWKRYKDSYKDIPQVIDDLHILGMFSQLPLEDLREASFWIPPGFDPDK